MGRGGIIINVVVVLKGMIRCGWFEDPCSTLRTRCMGVGWGGGVGRNNYKCCSCIEGRDTLWLMEDPCNTARASMLTYTR